MKRILPGLLWVGLGLAPALANPTAAPTVETAGALCHRAIVAAEARETLPAQLLRSIAIVESGRTDPATGRAQSWPWTINAAGAGFFYDSKSAAIAAVRTFQAAGVQSIDVGCAQVNLLHHPRAFASLEEAFDPEANANYAARFLRSLFRTTGNWPAAAAGYHSLTPDLGYAYAQRVMAIWPGSERYGTLAVPATATPRVPAIDYSLYTPVFAAQLRRMEEDRRQRTRVTPVPVQVWVRQPPEPRPLPPPGTRRTTDRGLPPRG